MTRSLHRACLLAAAMLVALGGWLVAASPAEAHNVLRSTTPADQASVDRVPTEVVLTFDQPALAMGTEIAVIGPSGPVSAGPARLIDNTVRQTIGADAPAGQYTVHWRVTSADGHPVTGTFAFTARRAGGGSVAPDASATEVPSVVSTSGATGGTKDASGSSAGVPSWIWLVIAAALLLSALTSMAAARRRRNRS